MTRIARFTLLVAAVLAPVALAAPGDDLVARLKELQPALPIESVEETAFDGMLAIELEDGSVLYGTADGRFLFTGDMYSVGSEGFVNLTDSIRAERRRELLAGVSRDDMIVFPPVGERKAYVNVFTDVDCGYCRKLHQEMAEINALGIEVRYLAFPPGRHGFRFLSQDRLGLVRQGPPERHYRTQTGQQHTAAVLPEPGERADGAG